VERNRKNRDKGRSLKERVPKKHYRSEQSEDALILSDELGVDVVSEFPGLKVEDGNVQAKEEEEVVEYELETFGKAGDPVRIYLKELGSLPLLTRGGKWRSLKRSKVDSGRF